MEGYVFAFDPSNAVFIRRPDLRTRVISLIDGGNIINVIPRTANLENTAYKMSPKGHLVVTDGETFSLDINEFGANI